MDSNQLRFLGYGVLIGLAVALWVAIAGWRRRRATVADGSSLSRKNTHHASVSPARVSGARRE